MAHQNTRPSDRALSGLRITLTDAEVAHGRATYLDFAARYGRRIDLAVAVALRHTLLSLAGDDHAGAKRVYYRDAVALAAAAETAAKAIRRGGDATLSASDREWYTQVQEATRTAPEL
jgi:hypothetical protein